MHQPRFSLCQHHSQTTIRRKHLTEIMKTCARLSRILYATIIFLSSSKQLIANKTRLMLTSKLAADFNKEVCHPESARGGKWIQFPPDSFHMQIRTTHSRADYMYGFPAISITISHWLWNVSLWCREPENKWRRLHTKENPFWMFSFHPNRLLAWATGPNPDQCF